MRVLVNASNLKQGGGVQVADSFCRYLDRYPSHHFYVVLPPVLQSTSKIISLFPNVTVYTHDFRNSISSLLFQKDSFLDSLVKEKEVDVVLTVFGPSRWKPKVPHLCGFARGQILPMDSPYLNTLSMREKVFNRIVKASFARSADYYWTENSAVSVLLEQVFPDKKVYTVSNSYNQVFDDKIRWKEYKLPVFDGITLLTITNSYPHKNLSISIRIAQALERKHPDLRFRFVFTIDESEFPQLSSDLRKHFEFVGKVDISECPSLYQQADIMFQPSLIECFTATYPEAMRMDIPIVTSDLSFARCLCADAAMYYSPLSAEAAAEQIYLLSVNSHLRSRLTESGRRQLKEFLNSEQRADRLVSILESIVR